jgi:hypothetical protein
LPLNELDVRMDAAHPSRRVYADPAEDVHASDLDDLDNEPNPDQLDRPLVSALAPTQAAPRPAASAAGDYASDTRMSEPNLIAHHVRVGEELTTRRTELPNQHHSR